MDIEQRFFAGKWLFVGIAALVLCLPTRGQAGKRVVFAEGRLSIELADGWSESDLNAKDNFPGFATQDQRSSLYLREIGADTGGSMDVLLTATVANYETVFRVSQVSETKTGQVDGPDKKWPAIFATLEAVVTKGAAEFPMRFYLLIFDTGDHLTLLQASTTMPVREAREQQIYAMIRSLVAKP
jgi:hypothetical protein